MAYSLLGAHVNNTISGIPETLQAWKPPLVVVLDHSDAWHDVKRSSPDTLFVGRVFQEFEPDFNQPDLDPITAAQDHCDRILPMAQHMGSTYDYWQGINEPIIRSSDAMERYAEFEAERVRIMHGEGFRVAVASFSVGNPELRYWSHFLPALEAAYQHDGALALHEYAWPTLDHEWPWYLLRHRKVYEGQPDRDWEGLPAHLWGLPLLITECGLDGLIERPDRARGWQARYPQAPERYLTELAWYDAQLQEDPYVIGAAIYCCGVVDWSWKSYDIWPDVAQALASQASPVYRLNGPWPPTPPPRPAISELGELQNQVMAVVDRILTHLLEPA